MPNGLYHPPLLTLCPTIAARGGSGCAARVAQAFGDHPEAAVTRMRWARATVADVFGTVRPVLARAA